MGDADVPSPIDFHDPAQARAWEVDTIERRPYRPQFFAAMAKALDTQFGRPISILELGSGPGHLAEYLLQHCNVHRYVALDFSPAMHALAAARLTAFLDRTEFVTRDFREQEWPAALGRFDAVVTMQAAHETRHKRHLVPLLKQARPLLSPQSRLLYSDHYAGAGKHPDLFLDAEAQPQALFEAGFTRIQRLLDLSGMALYEAAL